MYWAPGKEVCQDSSQAPGLQNHLWYLGEAVLPSCIQYQVCPALVLIYSWVTNSVPKLYYFCNTFYGFHSVHYTNFIQCTIRTRSSALYLLYPGHYTYSIQCTTRVSSFNVPIIRKVSFYFWHNKELFPVYFYSQ